MLGDLVRKTFIEVEVLLGAETRHRSASEPRQHSTGMSNNNYALGQSRNEVGTRNLERSAVAGATPFVSTCCCCARARMAQIEKFCGTRACPGHVPRVVQLNRGSTMLRPMSSCFYQPAL